MFLKTVVSATTTYRLKNCLDGPQKTFKSAHSSSSSLAKQNRLTLIREVGGSIFQISFPQVFSQCTQFQNCEARFPDSRSQHFDDRVEKTEREGSRGLMLMSTTITKHGGLCNNTCVFNVGLANVSGDVLVHTMLAMYVQCWPRVHIRVAVCKVGFVCILPATSDMRTKHGLST